MSDVREYTIIIGSKRYFDERINSFVPSFIPSEKNNFPQMVRKHDEFNKRVKVSVDGVEKKKDDEFDLTDFLIIKNSDYHSIVPTAHDRLSALIEELTTETAKIFIHNPTRTLEEYLHILKSQSKIELIKYNEKYEMVRNPQQFNGNMLDISKKVIGQDKALDEIGKSMWYLTHVDRKKPFVIMLYGNSSIGKTEMVREVASTFFNNRVFEKHLSMFKNIRSEYYLFGDDPNRTSIGFELLERESNIVFLDEFDKLPDYFYSVFYTLFDNTLFSDSTYKVDTSGLLIFLTSNYSNLNEMKKHLGLPIFYRIDKFIHFEDFSVETIRAITKMEIAKHVEESQGKLDADSLYKRVSYKVQATSENARTIKTIVQQEVEALLYEQLKKDCTHITE